MCEKLCVQVYTEVRQPAHIRVRVWMTIHLCSKELDDVSRIVRKISLKNTWKKTYIKKEEMEIRHNILV